MVYIPGNVPQPLPEPPEATEHHDHYLSDEKWGQVVRDAQKRRAEYAEAEDEFEESDFDESELED